MRSHLMFSSPCIYNSCVFPVWHRKHAFEVFLWFCIPLKFRMHGITIHMFRVSVFQTGHKRVARAK
jgi:hypothetical protein